VLVTALVGGCGFKPAVAALPAVAGIPDKQWNKGCADAKAGTYDLSKKSQAYEQGWQSCKGGESPAETARGGGHSLRGQAGRFPT
jgi:hypothetical protein